MHLVPSLGLKVIAETLQLLSGHSQYSNTFLPPKLKEGIFFPNTYTLHHPKALFEEK